MNKQKSKKDNEMKARLVIGYYFSLIRKQPRLMAGVLVAIPITVIVNGFIPALIIASALNKLSQKHFETSEFWSAFGGQIGLYVAVTLTGILTWRLVDYFMWRLEIRSQQEMSRQVFAHLINRGMDFHANNLVGSLVSQNNKLLNSYVRLADTTVFQVYPMIVSVIATIVILWPKAPFFVLGLIALCVIYVLTAIFISEPIRRIAVKWGKAESRQIGFLADVITNIMTVKSYARSNFENDRFFKATKRTRRNAERFAQLHQVQMNVFGVIGRSIASVAFILAIVSVIFFDQNVSTVFLIVSYTSIITEHLFRFGNDSLRSFNRAVGDAFDMAKTLGQTEEVIDPAKPEVSRINRGSVRFDKVTFAHADATKPLFNNLDISIKPGEKVGLVGQSGSGKTTFTKLLLRFSDIDSGAIEIDGQNIARIRQNDLREAIAFVPQEPMLFHRTIAENIGYGDLSVDRKAIEAAARMANADEFIVDLPKGYDTLVGERGIKLSGGQRQRVAIARAMLKNAPILVLDEATSALDSESEALIQDALWRLMEGRTAVVIAHRLSTIQRMDRILVMDNGKIVEQGSHTELLSAGGVYARLWARQSGGFLESASAE